MLDTRKINKDTVAVSFNGPTEIYLRPSGKAYYGKEEKLVSFDNTGTKLIIDRAVADAYGIEIVINESYKKESKKLKEYVNNEVQKAWDLLDDWFEREWGEIPYYESAKSIVVAEFPMTIVRDGSHTYEEGTGVVVLNLIDCRAWYYITDEDGDEYGEFTESYSNIQEMIDKLIQPMSDGEITESDFIERCENEVY